MEMASPARRCQEEVAIRMEDRKARQARREREQPPHLSEDITDEVQKPAPIQKTLILLNEESESNWSGGRRAEDTPVRGRMVDPDPSTSPQVSPNYPQNSRCVRSSRAALRTTDTW
jgi:hypothetical protein